MEQKLMKVCTGCGEEKEATTEYFSKRKASKDGFMSKCKKCQKQYSEKNKDKIKEYRDSHKKQNSIYQKEYRQNHKEEMKEYRENHKQYYKQHRKENKEKLQEYESKYRKENKEKLTRYNKIWQQNNHEKTRIYTQNRNAKKNNLPNTLTEQQWQDIKEIFNNKCAYCNEEKPLEQEHVIPLSKGGEYTGNNIIPSCKSCNCSKGNKDFKVWYKGQDYYSKEREQFILNHLGYKENEKVQQLKFA